MKKEKRKDSLFDGKKILITGGTGSLGQSITTKILQTNVDTIRIFSRGENDQNEMKNNMKDPRLRFLIGDIRDKERLNRAFEDIDIVIHSAALKQIPVTEYNAFEAIQTNVLGSQNVIDCCINNDVNIALAIGTDKAVSPINTYGASKFLMERLFVSANYYKGSHKTKFICVRYGNVMNSRGSVIPLFINKIKRNEKITITDYNMTRFNITLDQAWQLIHYAIKNGNGGEIFVPQLKAYRLEILTEAIKEILNAKNKTEFMDIRSGEKFHECLISKDELRYTYELGNYYIILDQFLQKDYPIKQKKMVKTHLKDEYSSQNVEVFSKNQLKGLLKDIINEEINPQK